MFSRFDILTRRLLEGSLLLILCCLFYLAWWFIAFKPTGAVKGLRSGWLLIPAAVFGTMSVVQMIRGCSLKEGADALFPQMYTLVGGLIAYVVLFLISCIGMKRQVTTELLLIVVWAALSCAQLNALFSQGVFTKSAALICMVLIVVAAVVSLVCYLLYYGLDSRMGYIDGAIPLILALVAEIGISIGIFVRVPA